VDSGLVHQQLYSAADMMAATEKVVAFMQAPTAMKTYGKLVRPRGTNWLLGNINANANSYLPIFQLPYVLSFKSNRNYCVPIAKSGLGLIPHIS
jgi:hypothetical protein